MQFAISRAVLGATTLFALAGAGAAAETERDTPVEPLDTVTIIGHKPDAADVPGSAQVVDNEQLLTFVASDILRVLRTVPGVYLQEEDGFGLRPNIGIRGSGLDRSARIALLEDGVLIAPAPYSAPSAYYFPTQRRMYALEVLKGPAAIVVGPRTTGGALNMISTPIPDALGAAIDFRAGENRTTDVVVNVGDRGERLSWLVETVQSASDGFKRIDGPVGGDTGFDIEDYLLKLQLDNDPAASVYHSLRFKAGFTEQLSDETYLGLTDADFAVNPYSRYAASAGDVFASEHSQYQLSYVVDPERNWRGEVTVYRNDFERNWYKLQSVNGVGISSVLDDPSAFTEELGYLKGDTSADDAIRKRANNRSYYSEGVQAKLEWNLGFGPTEVGLKTGLRIHKDEEDRFQHEDAYRMQDGALVVTTAGAPGSQSNRVSSADVRSLFVAADIRVGAWLLTPGLRYEDIEFSRLDFSTADPTRTLGPTRVRDNSLSVLIPGFGALYRLNSHWRVLAGVHKGFNPPAPGSSAGEETSLNIEAGLRYNAGAFGVEAIYFHNDYDNLVGTVTNSTGGGGEIGDQFDGGKVIVSGLEFGTEYAASAGQLQIPLALKYTWTDKAEFENAFESDFEPWGEVNVGDELPYIPEHQLQATVGLASTRWRVDLAANYIDKMRSTAGQGRFEPDETVVSHVVWDMVAAWQFTSKLSAYAKVDNLFDETYVAARRPAGVRPGLPRTAYLGFTYRL